MKELIETFSLYSQLRYEQDGRKKEIHSDDKTVLLNQINVLKNSEIINEEEPSLLEDIIKKSNFVHIKKEVNDMYKRLKILRKDKNI